MISFHLSVMRLQLSKYLHIMLHEGTTVVLLTFHSPWGLWGCSHPAAAALNLSDLPWLPHLDCLLLCMKHCFQAPVRDRGHVNFCQALSGCGAANGSMLNAFALISADCRVYKERLSGTVSVCLLVIDSPSFHCFVSFSKVEKTNTGHFSQRLDCIYYDMLWCVSEAALFGNV